MTTLPSYNTPMRAGIPSSSSSRSIFSSSCISLYSFQATNQNQLSFPANTVIDVDTTSQQHYQSINNGWMYGRLYDSQSRQFRHGWFPQSYVQMTTTMMTSSPQQSRQPQQQQYSQPQYPQQQYPQSRSRFTDTIDDTTRSTTTTTTPMNATLTNIHNRVNMGESMYVMGGNGGDGVSIQNSSRNPDAPTTTAATTTTVATDDDDTSSSGFDTQTHTIMGGTILNGSNESKDDDDMLNNQDGNNNGDGNHNKKKGGWFGLRSKFGNNKRNKIQPLAHNNNNKAAKEPEWYAEPQIVLSDGTIIQEYQPNRNRGLFSHLSNAATTAATTTKTAFVSSSGVAGAASSEQQ